MWQALGSVRYRPASFPNHYGVRRTFLIGQISAPIFISLTGSLMVGAGVASSSTRSHSDVRGHSEHDAAKCVPLGTCAAPESSLILIRRASFSAARTPD
jgi:hypothetical protein